jgi:tetratricopeptide (TPR) repeat protein
MRSCFTLFLLSALALNAADDLAQARSLIAAKRVPEARPLLEALVVASPGDVDALLLLGECQAKMQQPEASLATLEKAATLAPKRADVANAYGRLCLEQAGKERSLSLIKKGRSQLERALELDPKMVEPRLALITFFSAAPWFAGGSMDKAYAQVEALEKLDAKLALVMKVSLMNKEKKYEEALAVLDGYLKQNADDYTANYEFGRAVSQSGKRSPEGLAALRKCLTLTPPKGSPGHDGVHYRMGLIFQNTKDYSSARAELDEALKSDPKNRQFIEARAKLPAP